MRDRLLITAEHAGHRVPARYAALFAGRERMLESHRGHDHGSRALARTLARRLGAPLCEHTITRLLVEVNRKLDHPALFSSISARLPENERERVLRQYHVPHRSRVEGAVAEGVAGGRRIVHVAVHTFAPRLRGRTRRVGVGLLYDPSRREEAAFCARWKASLRRLAPRLIVRRNQPYQGRTDGLTTTLRRRFAGGDYLGIELEVNQRFSRGDPARWRRLRETLAASLEDAMGAK
jgi:predicted N-formylglutamate amidohydrolase